MTKENLEENFKAAGWKEITCLKQGVCRCCGGDIVMFWGIVFVEEGSHVPVHHQLFGPDPKPWEKVKKIVSHGPVCEGCGLLYSPFFLKNEKDSGTNSSKQVRFYRDGLPD